MRIFLETLQHRAAPLLAVVMCVAALMELALRSTSVPAARPTHSSAHASERQTLAQLLWPGTFDASPSTTQVAVGFTASGRRYTARVRSDGFSVGPEPNGAPEVDIHFINARPGGQAGLAAPRTDRLSLFSGSDGVASVTRLYRFDEVGFQDAYPGIGTRYRSNAGDLELDFLIQAGANPDAIALEVGSGSTFSVESSTGDVIASRGQTKFRLHRPRAYQPGLGGPVEVSVSAVIEGHTLRFAVPRYDSTKTLTIDPLIAE